MIINPSRVISRLTKISGARILFPLRPDEYPMIPLDAMTTEMSGPMRTRWRGEKRDRAQSMDSVQFNAGWGSYRRPQAAADYRVQNS